jgi:archaellum component FlaC
MEAKYLLNDVSNDVRCMLEMFYSYEDIKDNLNVAIMLGGGRAYIWKMNEELKEYDLQVKYKEGTLHFEVCK